jgi:hypothetical protein
LGVKLYYYTHQPDFAETEVAKTFKKEVSTTEELNMQQSGIGLEDFEGAGTSSGSQQRVPLAIKQEEPWMAAVLATSKAALILKTKGGSLQEQVKQIIPQFADKTEDPVAKACHEQLVAKAKVFDAAVELYSKEVQKPADFTAETAAAYISKVKARLGIFKSHFDGMNRLAMHCFN